MDTHETLPSPRETISGQINGAERSRYSHLKGAEPQERRELKGAGKIRTSGSTVGLSITVLTLDTGSQFSIDNNRNNRINAVESEVNDINELRLVRDFQIRRKYERHLTPVAQQHAPKFVELGLLGTKYFDSGDKQNLTNVLGKDKSSASYRNESLKVGVNGSPVPGQLSGNLPGLNRTDEGRNSVDHVAKNTHSSSNSILLPTLMLSPRGSFRHENSFYTARNLGSRSLLLNDFGFNTIRPDTFSGLSRHRGLRAKGSPVVGSGGEEHSSLMKEFEKHVERQILACQNTGYFHRGSRAAENVMSFRQTISPHAFHTPAVSRHVPREDRKSAGISGATALGDEEKRKKRVVYPGAPGRLGGLEHHSQVSPRPTLPSIDGNSVQVAASQEED